MRMVEAPPSHSLVMPVPPGDINVVHDLLQQVWQSEPTISMIDQICFETALIELASNVIRHATAGRSITFELVITTDSGHLEAVLCDTGGPSDVQLSGRTMPDDEAESGRGLVLIQTLVDELSYDRVKSMNCWRIRRRLEI